MKNMIQMHLQDTDDYFDNMDETGSPIDRPSDLRVQQLQAFFAGATDSPAEQAIEARLRFGKDSINSPKMSRDHFGREIIRLFNEMGGFRDSPEVNSVWSSNKIYRHSN